jgi:predicted HAD superfamily hydrolase
MIKDIISKRYSVSADGIVKNIHRDTNVSFSLTKKGYLKARLYCPEISKNKDNRKPFSLHRLVAMFHLKDFDDKLQVNHINGIKSDNRVSNLEMNTNSQNVYHAWNTLDSTERKQKLNNKRDSNGRFR